MSRIGAKEVCELTGYSRRRLQEFVKAKKFPLPGYDGIHPVWERSEVDGWLEKGGRPATGWETR